MKAPHEAPIAEGRAVTGFTNSEEAAMNLVDVVPYLLEDVLKAHNGHLLRPVESFKNPIHKFRKRRKQRRK